MKILSWNIYKNNKKLNEVIDFIINTDADIICLQEVPTAEIKNFTKLYPYKHVAEENVVYARNKRVDKMHLLLLSNYPIQAANVVRHQPDTAVLKKYDTFELDFHYIDVNVNNIPLRIFNLHLKCMAGPNYRRQQLQEALIYINAERVPIICGDFNTFSRFRFNWMIWWFFGFAYKDITVNERKKLKIFFETNKIANHFDSVSTFSKFPLQLDYILVPQSMVVTNYKRYKKRYGSDHYPIELECAI